MRTIRKYLYMDSKLVNDKLRTLGFAMGQKMIELFLARHYIEGYNGALQAVDSLGMILKEFFGAKITIKTLDETLGKYQFLLEENPLTERGSECRI